MASGIKGTVVEVDLGMKAPVKELGEAALDLSVGVGPASIQAVKQLGGFIGQLGDAFAKVKAPVLRAAPNLAPLIQSLGEMTRGIEGTVVKVGVDLKASSEQLGEASLNVGVAVGPASVKAIENLGEFIRKLGDAFAKVQPQVLQAASGLVPLTNSLGGLVSGIKDIGGTVTDVGIKTEGLKIGVSVAPAIVAVIEELGSFAANLVKAFEDVKAPVLQAAPALVPLVNSLGSLMGGIKDIKGTFTDTGLKVGGFKLGSTVGPAVIGVIEGLGNFMETLLDEIEDVDASVLKAMPNLAQLIDSLTSLLTGFGKLGQLDIRIVGLGFGQTVGFIKQLGTTLASFSSETLSTMAPLASLIDGLSRLNQLSMTPIGLSGAGLGELAAPPSANRQIPFPVLATATPSSEVRGTAGVAIASPRSHSPMLAAGAAQSVDQSVTLENVTITINAERLEADSAQLLSDEIVHRLRERLDMLRTEQAFRTGTRYA